VQGNDSRGRGTVSSGVLTGISTAVVSGSAAIAGVILSRKFGHGVKTDGFFAAYAVYLALVLVASALRVIALPRFALARAEHRLGGELATWLGALAVPLIPIVVIAIVWPEGVAHALTGGAEARHSAADLVPWLVPAAAVQVVAGVLASALAALDDYVVAAVAFAAGAVVGLVAIALLVGHGVVAFGWGLALNAAVAVTVPAVVLATRGVFAPPDRQPLQRLWLLAEGVALPFALQGLYVIAYRFAAGVGPGEATTFSYAYLIVAFLVAVTATSVALVATVPFAREGASPERAARHVVSIAWVSLALVAAAAGVFALAGAPVVKHVLGSSYGGSTGAELGHLVVYFAPWMVTSVAVTVAYPLVFVRGRARWLPALAVAALLVEVAAAWIGRSAFGLAGIAASLAVTTGAVLLALLVSLHAAERALRGLAVAAVAVGALAAAAFGIPAALLGPVAAAAAGLLLYTLALGALRPPGLRHAWAYLRSLQ
jgi:O-antigen/teichoic acid export membrane protein